MKNLELDYSNGYEVRKYIETKVVPSVYDTLVTDYYDGNPDDINTELNDNVWEIINDLSDVIYNYQSKMVALAYDYCPFDSYSEMTGEKFQSYSEMTFEIIYNEFYSQYSEYLEL